MFSAEMANCNTPQSPIPSTSHESECVKRVRMIPLLKSDDEDDDDDVDDVENYVTDAELEAMTVEAPGKSFVSVFVA